MKHGRIIVVCIFTCVQASTFIMSSVIPSQNQFDA